MWAKIKDFFSRNLDLILTALVAAGAFFLGRFVRFPGPYQPGEPRHFTNAEEFKTWYGSRFLKYWMFLTGDCDDRADYVRRTALKDGFVLSDALISGGLYYGVPVSSVVMPHNSVIARCGNEYWFCEINDGNFVKICNID
jgi:hypothetical protein